MELKKWYIASDWQTLQKSQQTFHRNATKTSKTMVLQTTSRVGQFKTTSVENSFIFTFFSTKILTFEKFFFFLPSTFGEIVVTYFMNWSYGFNEQ